MSTRLGGPAINLYHSSQHPIHFCAAGRNACADRIVRARANVHLDLLSLLIEWPRVKPHAATSDSRHSCFGISAQRIRRRSGRPCGLAQELRLLLGRERALGVKLSWSSRTGTMCDVPPRRSSFRSGWPWRHRRARRRHCGVCPHALCERQVVFLQLGRPVLRL